MDKYTVPCKYFVDFNKFWTYKEDVCLLYLYNNKKFTITEIGKYLYRNPFEIYLRLKNHNIIQHFNESRGYEECQQKNITCG